MEVNAVNAEALNDLVEINNDRIVGYEKAIEELKPADEDLRNIFTNNIQQSQQLKSELSGELARLGAEPTTDTTTRGKIYRAWMDVKAVFTGHDRETVLNNCEFGEDAAQNAYKMALDTDGVSHDMVNLISKQKGELKLSHDTIRGLREQAKH